MTRAAAQTVELRASRLAGGRGIPMAEVAVDSVIVMHAPCTGLPVRTAGMRRRCLFSREKTDRCIAVSAINRNVLIEQTTDDRVGNLHAEIVVNPGDSFEVALKRFSRKVQEAGILPEARRRRHYESPQARRRRKAEAQRRKRRRTR